jgi:hypothetical protein
MLGAVLRFAGIGSQSYWFDEAVTVRLVDGSLGNLLHGIPHSESTPPLYYLAAWAWSNLFGTSEAALRSLSACFGTALVAVVWAIARALGGKRSAIAAAIVVAVNPTLVWFSQEARAYSLLALLGALGFWAFMVALREPSKRSLALWALCGAASLSTHYFAVFVLAAEATYLLWKLPGRRAAVAVASAVPVATGLALLPLALGQEADGRTSWIAAGPLGDRLWEVVRELGTGGSALVTANPPHPGGLLWVGGLPGTLLAAYGLARLPSGRARTGAMLALSVGAAGVLLPLVLTVSPADFFFDRNLLAAWPMILLALGAGACAPILGRAGPVALASIAIAGIGTTILVATDADRQRDNWRGLVRSIGPRTVPRAIVVRPAFAQAPLAVYGHPVEALRPGTGVREIVVIGEGVAAETPVRRLGAYRLAGTKREGRVGILRYRAPDLQRLSESDLAAAREQVLYEPSNAARAWVAQGLNLLVDMRAAVGSDSHQPDLHRLRQLVAEARALPTTPAELPDGQAARNRLDAIAAALEEVVAQPTLRHRAEAQRLLGIAPSK